MTVVICWRNALEWTKEENDCCDVGGAESYWKAIHSWQKALGPSFGAEQNLRRTNLAIRLAANRKINLQQKAMKTLQMRQAGSLLKLWPSRVESKYFNWVLCVSFHLQCHPRYYAPPVTACVKFVLSLFINRRRHVFLARSGEFTCGLKCKMLSTDQMIFIRFSLCWFFRLK